MSRETENFPGDRTKAKQPGRTRLSSSGTQFLCDLFNLLPLIEKPEHFLLSHLCRGEFAKGSKLRLQRSETAEGDLLNFNGDCCNLFSGEY